MSHAAVNVTLRDVIQADVDVFYGHVLEDEARRMSAFTRDEYKDADFYRAHWVKLAADDSMTARAILCDEQLVGYVAKFVRDGDAEVTYWLGHAHWGRGIATKALRLFVELLDTRPLHGRVVADNIGSLRVLQKCGFQEIGRETSFAPARGEDVEEIVLLLS